MNVDVDDLNTYAWQTDTPALLFTSDFIYMFANVSSLVNAKWYLGKQQ